MLYDNTTMNKVVTIQKFIDKTLTLEETIKHLWCSERTIYRYASKYRLHGPPWLIHGLKWRYSNNRNKKWEFLEQYVRQKRFDWFWPTLLSEKLEDIMGYPVPIESLRRRMTEWWIWKPRKPRKVKKHPRKRKDWYWMMILIMIG